MIEKRNHRLIDEFSKLSYNSYIIIMRNLSLNYYKIEEKLRSKHKIILSTKFFSSSLAKATTISRWSPLLFISSHVPRPRSRFFRVCGPKTWNALSVHIRNSAEPEFIYWNMHMNNHINLLLLAEYCFICVILIWFFF